MEKHSSLFANVISDEGEKSFIAMSARSTELKKFYWGADFIKLYWVVKTIENFW